MHTNLVGVVEVPIVSINNNMPLTELLLTPGANSLILVIIREIQFMTLKRVKEVNLDSGVVG